MAQHDFDVANGSGAAVRSDFNDALEALTTLSSGATAPATMYPYQLWLDTASGALKQRNGANTLWAYFEPGFMPNHISPNGLIMSRDAGDVTNDINVTAGAASNSTNTKTITLASAITKRLDAAWAVGTAQGGLDTGAVGNNWYHVFIIERVDTGVVDVLFSLSATAPTLPTNYTLFRRIGSFKRTAASNVAFTQYNDRFIWATKVDDFNSVAAYASALTTLTVATGVIVQPIFGHDIFGAGAQNILLNVGSAITGSANMFWASIFMSAADGNARHNNLISSGIFTNTSAQIYFAQALSSGAPTASVLSTYGWIDPRQ